MDFYGAVKRSFSWSYLEYSGHGRYHGRPRRKQRWVTKLIRFRSARLAREDRNND
jgi:hypothetical protein